MTAASVTESLVRVNYSETDQMGVAYHARYLVWLDIARTEHLRRCGLSYRDLEAAGLRLAVSEVAISTKQHDSPKNMGHMELARPQLTRSSSLASRSESLSASGIPSGSSTVMRLG